MILGFFILIVIGVLSGIRGLYWLAVVQQKEYRWDRCRLFLTTPEGVRAVNQFLPSNTVVARFKRPRLTVRIAAIGFLSGILWLVGWLGGILISASIIVSLGRPEELVWLGWLIMAWWGVCLVLSVPIFVAVATVPTSLVSLGVTHVRIIQAQRLLKKTHPIIIGITGSYGKTSVRHVLAAVMGGETHVYTPQGSHNTRYSVASDVVHRYHRQPLVILEYAAYTENEIARLAKLFPPQEAIVTGVTWQHVGLFGSLQQVVNAKAELIVALPSRSAVYWNGSGLECERIVQVGRKKHRKMYQSASQLAIHSITPESVGMSRLTLSQTGCLSFSLADRHVVTRLVGLQYSQNIAMAVAVARQHGMADELICQRLSDFQPSDYFTRSWKTKDGILVIDDGLSSNPVGFKALIATSTQLSAPPKILITGGIVDLGSESDRIHVELAHQSREVFDTVCYVGVVGVEQFQKEFQRDCLVGTDAILAFLDQVPSSSLVAIEGKMPGWLAQHNLMQHTDNG